MDEIAEMLLDIREKQKASNLYLNEDGYVYLNKKGKPVRPNYITEHFPQVLNEFHLKHIRYHDLEHSCASILLSDEKRYRFITRYSILAGAQQYTIDDAICTYKRCNNKSSYGRIDE